MTLLNRPEFSVGVNMLKPTISYQNRGSTAATPLTGGIAVPYAGNDGGDPGRWQPVPNVFAAFPTAGRKLWFGVGLRARKPDEVAAMLRLKGLGWGARRIAAEFGCSHMTVRRYLDGGGWLA